MRRFRNGINKKTLQKKRRSKKLNDETKKEMISAMEIVTSVTNTTNGERTIQEGKKKITQYQLKIRNNENSFLQSTGNSITRIIKTANYRNNMTQT